MSTDDERAAVEAAVDAAVKKCIDRRERFWKQEKVYLRWFAETAVRAYRQRRGDGLLRVLLSPLRDTLESIAGNAYLHGMGELPNATKVMRAINAECIEAMKTIDAALRGEGVGDE